MSRPTMVYIKREMKKVLPLLVLAVLYTTFIYLMVYMETKDIVPLRLLALAGHWEISEIYESGDLFLYNLRQIMDKSFFFYVIFFEFILILRLFATENRLEVSDFIRTLPLKEWKKTWIKAGVGEAVILVFCLLFGLAGTVMNAVYTPQIREFNEVIPGGTTNTDSCLMLWQIVLFVFLAMSAIYLILFAVQLCIHNMLLAYAVGGGILLSIEYFVAMFANIYGEMGAMGISGSIKEYLPYRSETVLEYMYDTIFVYDLEWSLYTDRLLFLLLLCAIGIAMILLSIRCRWCIRENNFLLLNSNVVLQFILTGISLAAGMGISFASGNAPLIGIINRDAKGEFRYWMLTIGIAALFLTAFNLTIMLRKKKQRRG